MLRDHLQVEFSQRLMERYAVSKLTRMMIVFDLLLTGTLVVLKATNATTWPLWAVLTGPTLGCLIFFFILAFIFAQLDS